MRGHRSCDLGGAAVLLRGGQLRAAAPVGRVRVMSKTAYAVFVCVWKAPLAPFNGNTARAGATHRNNDN